MFCTKFIPEAEKLMPGVTGCAGLIRSQLSCTPVTYLHGRCHDRLGGTLIDMGSPSSPLPWRLTLEEIASAVTHGIGLLLGIAGFAVLLAFAILHGTASRIIACSIYGATLICLYAASTLYHAVNSPRLKRALKIFDHSAIYLLIAGTYTPFLLLNLRGAWGRSLFGVVWGLAFAGIVFKSL